MIFVLLANVLFTVRLSVAIESQPPLPVNVTEYTPAKEYDCAFQLYGNWSVHMVILVVLVSVLLTARINVATESHPLLLINVTV